MPSSTGATNNPTNESNKNNLNTSTNSAGQLCNKKLVLNNANNGFLRGPPAGANSGAAENGSVLETDEEDTEGLLAVRQPQQEQQQLEPRIVANPLMQATMHNTVVRYTPVTNTVTATATDFAGLPHQKRTHLERYLIIAIVILVLICLGFFVFSILLRADCAMKEPERKVCLTEECVRTASSLLAAMDRSANPCVDFFQFACGTWNKKHVIPEDRSSISTFEVLADQLQVILKGVLEEPINDHDSAATQKAKRFYNSCMNIQQIRRLGDAPLREVLDSLGGWPVTHANWEPPAFSIETLLGRLRGEFNEGVLIEQWVGPDDKNSSVNILQVRTK